MNKLIIDNFEALLKQAEAEFLYKELHLQKGDNNSHFFRVKAIKNVLGILKRLDFVINSSEDLIGIPGITETTLKRISEILKTGHLIEIKNKYDAQTQTTLDNIKALTDIIGIGNANAKKLILENNICSVAQLKEAVTAGKIKVSNQVMLGLKYNGVVKGAIPRSETTHIYQYLKTTARSIDSKLSILICGSYRRGAATSGDVDVLLYHPTVRTEDQIKNATDYHLPQYLEILVTVLSNKQFLLDDMTDKNYQTKYMGFCQYLECPVRRIDIHYTAYDNLATASLYFTGPHQLNVVMRQLAKNKKMRLNEHGLYSVQKETKKKLLINNEKQVFAQLGMDYLTPKQREIYNTGKK